MACSIRDVKRIGEVSAASGECTRSLGDFQVGKGRGGEQMALRMAGVALSRNGERVSTKQKNVEHSMRDVE